MVQDDINTQLQAFAEQNTGQESMLLCCQEAEDLVQAALQDGRLQAHAAEAPSACTDCDVHTCTALKYAVIWCDTDIRMEY
jgi:hypothetical protein